MKRNNTYKILLKEVTLKDGVAGSKSLSFEFENHDNIFNIISAIQEMHVFEDDSQAVEFALGIKLFSEVMLKNKDTNYLKS